MEWTREEKDLLLKYYSVLGPKKLSKQLRRPIASIGYEARKLGLYRGVKASNHERRNKWCFKDFSYDLGYIVGVYLGDGTICTTSSGNSYFRLNSIDHDFCKAVAYKLKLITGYKSSIKYLENKGQYVMTFSNSDFARWLGDNFGGPNEKQLVQLGGRQENMGLIEGIFDSEGTVTSHTFVLRMQGDLAPIQWILFEQLGIVPGRRSKPNRVLSYSNLRGISTSNREYTRVGLGTYIKRKAKNGITYKNYNYCDYKNQCRNDSKGE